ncbi:hypothetical protein [Bacillus sp. V59.32b]|nr:hypothetical protein [Bacillus sp. V59.32b]
MKDKQELVGHGMSFIRVMKTQMDACGAERSIIRAMKAQNRVHSTPKRPS